MDFHLWNQVQKNGVFVSVIDGQEMRFRVWNISVDGDLMAETFAEIMIAMKLWPATRKQINIEINRQRNE